MNNFTNAFFVISLIVGLILTTVGVIFIFNYFKTKKACTKFVYGTVIGNEKEIKRRRKSGRMREEVWTYYSPIISFLVNGVEYKRTGDIGRGTLGHDGTPQYSVGEKLEIAYNPNDLQQFFVVKDRKVEIITSLMMAVFGIGVLCISVLIGVRSYAPTAKITDLDDSVTESIVGSALEIPSQSEETLQVVITIGKASSNIVGDYHFFCRPPNS